MSNHPYEMGKGKALAVDLDVEQFIQNIQERPVIWDRYVHVQKPVVYQMWRDLSRIHGLPGKLYFALLDCI